MPNERVSRWLDDLQLLDHERCALVQTLREMILGLDSSVAEEVKYGGLLFSTGKPFCGIFSYARHVSLEFGAGAALADAFGVLEGEGKARRHIKLAATQDIAEKHVGEYLLLAFRMSSTA